MPRDAATLLLVHTEHMIRMCKMPTNKKQFYKELPKQTYIDFIKWLNKAIWTKDTRELTSKFKWCRLVEWHTQKLLFLVERQQTNWLISIASNILTHTLTTFLAFNYANWIHNHPGCCWNAWAICYSNSLATCKPYHLSLLRQNQINHERKVTMTPAFIHYIKSKHGRIKRIAKQYEHRKTKS